MGAKVEGRLPAAPTTRDFGADLLKAVSIVGVVFIHADGIFGRRSAFYDVVGDAFRFGVPVFIALYVHFVCKGMDRRGPGTPYLCERFVRLLLQYIVWSTVYAVVAADWPELSPIKFITRRWSGNGWAGQYYFIIILQLTVLMPWLRASGRWLEHRRAWLIVGGVMFYGAIAEADVHVSPLIPRLGDRPFIYWIPFAWLGVAWVNNTAIVSSRVVRLALWSSVALIPIEHRLIDPPGVTNSVYLMPSVFIATAALLTLTRTVRSPRSAGPPHRGHRVVALLSANTLGIFVLNPLIISKMHAVVPQFRGLTGPWASIGLQLLALLIALGLSLAATLALKRIAVVKQLVS